MRLPCIRFTIRSLLMAVALVGLNLAGAIATSRYYPRPFFFNPVGFFHWNGVNAQIQHEDGVDCRYRLVGGIERSRLGMVIRYALPPTLLRIWSPVMASAAITLLALLVPLPFSRSRRRSLDRKADGVSRAPRSGLRTAARWFAVAVALLALNLAGFASRPPADYTKIRLDYPALFGGIPETVILRLDVFSIQRVPVNEPRVTRFMPQSLARRGWEGYRFSEGTIDYRSDGSIVAYVGSPGRRLSEPFTIRTPTRSTWEAWRPMIASTSITVLVIVAVCLAALRGWAGRSHPRNSAAPAGSDGDRCRDDRSA